MYESILGPIAAFQEQVATALRHAAREVLNAKLGAATPPSDALLPAHDTAPSSGTHDADRRGAVLDAAVSEWRRGVAEPGTKGMPNGAGIIDGYIRGPQGLAWKTTDVKTWVPGVPYTKNGSFKWCGAFAAWVHGAAGLRQAVRQKHFAGTPRLWSWAHGTPRFICCVEALLPGDAVVVGPAGDTDGAHIAIFTGLRPGGASFDTIEGNAHGVGPAGNRYEGVVRQVRPVHSTRQDEYRFTFGVHPLPEDYE